MYLVECYNDETVLRVLGVPKRSIRRMRGKGNVMNALKQDPDVVHIGMVDHDVRSANPVPLGPFTLEAVRDGVSLHVWKTHRLVVVHDRVEDWIMSALSAAGLQLSTFHLPATDAAGLHRVEMQLMDTRLVNALGEAVKREPAQVRTLREFLGIK